MYLGFEIRAMDVCVYALCNMVIGFCLLYVDGMVGEVFMLHLGMGNKLVGEVVVWLSRPLGS